MAGRARVSAKERAEAMRQVQEVMRVEREGVRIARAITTYLRKEAIAALKERRQLSVKKEIYAQLLDTLEKAMQVTALLGIRRAILSSKGQTLQLDFLDNQLEILTNLLEAYYGDRTQFIAKTLGSRLVTSAVELVRNIAESTQAALRATINTLISEGATVAYAQEKLAETFEQQGLTGTSWQLETTFRTQTQLAYNGASYRAYQDSAIQEILWGYKYVTVGDDRVRPEHEAWDGVTLPKDDVFWLNNWPPNGWNCRCAVIPIYEERRIVQPADLNARPDEAFQYNPGLV